MLSDVCRYERYPFSKPHSDGKAPGTALFSETIEKAKFIVNWKTKRETRVTPKSIRFIVQYLMYSFEVAIGPNATMCP